MTQPHGFIEVHDAATVRKKRPEGKAVLVRASAIDYLRGYSDGRVRCIVGHSGVYLHVTETVDEVVRMIEATTGLTV